MNSPVNDWIAKSLAIADEGGWMVLRYSAELPAQITIGDDRGTEITISDRYGLTIRDYLGQLKAIPRQKHAEVEK